MASTPLPTGRRGRPTMKRKHEDSLREVRIGNSESSHSNGQTAPSSLPPQSTNSFGDFSPEEYDAGLSILQQLPEAVQSTKRIYEASNDPLMSWLPYRDDYLDEMIKLECRGALMGVLCQVPLCSTPHSGSQPLFRCNDCFYSPLMCRACCLRLHFHGPFHRVKMWNDYFFQDISLTAMGYFMCLGHSGEPCPITTNICTQMTMLHTNGLHFMNVKFCSCPSSPPRRIQLLRSRLFPATDEQPRTCATFDLLHHTHILLLQSNISTFHIYNTLRRLTDNSGIVDIPSFYKSMLTIIRKWRYLTLMKRFGRAHDGEGVRGTAPGMLAVSCPVCPDPDVNLPEDWDAAGNDKSYLYERFYAGDACFRLKNRECTADTSGLITGLAYFVADAPYRDYLATYPTQTETSTCSGLSAVDHANTRKSTGLRSTGVGALVCARHGFFLPSGIGDLQKGERYANMDYIIFSAIRSCGGPWKDITLSYDIACQYFRNLRLRMQSENFPKSLRIDLDQVNIKPAIPKFHLPAHQERCHTVYCLNLQPGAGRLDGEVIERDWAKLGGAANSTKEMSAGARRDTLDDLCGDMNYTKLKMMVPQLLAKLKAARIAREQHAGAFDELSSSIEPSSRSKWLDMANRFHADKGQPNPYIPSTKKYRTLQEVRKELIEAEHRSSLDSAADISFATFIVSGLELEDAQHELRGTIASLKDGTALQLSSIAEARLSLGRRLHSFHDTQKTLMPFVAHHESPNDTPENVNLHLPSSFKPAGHSLPPSMVALGRLQTAEADLRFASAKESLDSLRHNLLVTVHYTKYKRENVRGQSGSTRLQSLLHQANAKTHAIAARYRRNRQAYFLLKGDGDWERELRPLLAQDVRPLQDSHISRNDMSRSGEGHKTVSWIWRSSLNQLDSHHELDEALRIEWLWSLARKERWEEEVEHLREEMRRFIVSANHRFQTWMTRCSTRGVATELSDGLCAYAYRQAFIIARQAIRASRLWDSNLPASAVSWIPPNIVQLVHNFGNDIVEWHGAGLPEYGEIAEGLGLSDEYALDEDT